MAEKFKFELNRAGVKELMQSSEMKAIVDEYAAAAAKNAGSGFSWNSQTGKTRIVAEVTADTIRAKIENSKNNTLLKALGASK